MVGDMPILNDQLFRKEVITSVSRTMNEKSVFNFFSRMAGGMVGSEQSTEKGPQSMMDIRSRGVGSEFIRNRKYRETMYPAKIVDNSRVPDTLVAGLNFELTQDKFIGEGGEKIMLKDQKTQIMVVSYRATGDNKTFDYTYQLIGPDGFTRPGSLLSVDSTLHYGMGNTVGEFSLTGNTLVDDGDRYTDTFNILQIARYVIPKSGSFASDETIKFSAVEAMDGTSVNVDFVTDLPYRGTKQVFAAIDRDLLFSVPNFSVVNKTIANKAGTTRYSERPSYAGFFYQWDLAPYQYPAYASAPLSEGVQLIKDILSFMRNEVGTSKKYIAYCQGRGRQWLKAVFDEARKSLGYQINIVVDANMKLGGPNGIGYDIDEYTTPDGTLSIIDLGSALTSWGAGFDLSQYNGVGYQSRTNDIWIQGFLMEDGVTKKPATIYHKEGNGISRAFVLGMTRGMTGANGGLTGEQAMALQEEGIRRMMSNDRYRIDSPADGDELHILSQLCPFMDTDGMSRIHLYD